VLVVVVSGFAVVLAGPGGESGGPAGSASVAPAFPGAAPRDAGSAGDSRTLTGPATSPETGLAAPPKPDAPSQGVPVGGVQRSLVRTAQVTAEVDDPAASSRQVRTAAAAVGGFVTEEQSGDTGSWVVLRVPADSLDRLIEEIGGFARVTGRSTQVVDATEEVVDLDARVGSQQASVARVRSLLAQAESIGDVVAIESELSRREADLDSLTGRLTALRDQVALSTLTVDLRGTATPPEDVRPLGFLTGLADGWDGLRALGSGVAAVVGFVLPFLPVLAVLAGIAWLARRIVRARRVQAPAAAAGAGGRSGPGTEGES
jgi:hypothetical protein